MPDSPTDSSSNETLAAEIDRLRGEVAAAALMISLLLAVLDRFSSGIAEIALNKIDELLIPVNDHRREGIKRFADRLAQRLPEDSPTITIAGHDDPPNG